MVETVSYAIYPMCDMQAMLIGYLGWNAGTQPRKSEVRAVKIGKKVEKSLDELIEVIIEHGKWGFLGRNVVCGSLTLV